MTLVRPEAPSLPSTTAFSVQPNGSWIDEHALAATTIVKSTRAAYRREGRRVNCLVYLGERIALEVAPALQGAAYESHGDVTARVREIISDAWFTSRYPHVADVRIQSGSAKARSSWIRRHGQGVFGLSIAPSMRNDFVVLHELAHIGHVPNGDGRRRPHHGPGFVHEQLELIDRYVGTQEAVLLCIVYESLAVI